MHQGKGKPPSSFQCPKWMFGQLLPLTVVIRIGNYPFIVLLHTFGIFTAIKRPSVFLLFCAFMSAYACFTCRDQIVRVSPRHPIPPKTGQKKSRLKKLWQDFYRSFPPAQRKLTREARAQTALLPLPSRGIHLKSKPNLFRPLRIPESIHKT